jgi:hypothetical protein
MIWVEGTCFIIPRLVEPLWQLEDIPLEISRQFSRLHEKYEAVALLITC